MDRNIKSIASRYNDISEENDISVSSAQPHIKRTGGAMLHPKVRGPFLENLRSEIRPVNRPSAAYVTVGPLIRMNTNYVLITISVKMANIGKFIGSVG